MSALVTCCLVRAILVHETQQQLPRPCTAPLSPSLLHHNKAQLNPTHHTAMQHNATQIAAHADEALVQLRAQLRADAPGPGDEADPYHDYLTDLAAQVAAAMAAPGPQAPAGSGGGAAATAAGAGAGAAAAAGRSGAAGAAEAGKGGSGIGRGGLKGEVEGVEVQQPVLALGGPSRVGPRLAGAVGGEGERGTAKGGSCSVGDGDAGDSDTGSGQCSASR